MKLSLKRRRSPEQLMEMEAAGNAPQEPVEGSGRGAVGLAAAGSPPAAAVVALAARRGFAPELRPNGHCRQRCGIRQHEITMRRREIACQLL